MVLCQPLKITTFTKITKIKKTQTSGDSSVVVFYVITLFNLLSTIVLQLNKNIFLRNTGSILSLSKYCLDLTFLRNRFFPQLVTIVNTRTIFNASLGIISGYFSKKKSFLRSKASYVLLAVYLRRILVSANLNSLELRVKGLPLHLKAILKNILSKSNVLYKDPYNPVVIKNELSEHFNFCLNFSYVVFVNSKFHGNHKVKQKGRLKRKIARRVSSLNSILD